MFALTPCVLNSLSYSRYNMRFIKYALKWAGILLEQQEVMQRWRRKKKQIKEKYTNEEENVRNLCLFCTYIYILQYEFLV